MTNKGKVITAIIVVAVVLAGAAGFYFKGGDLMGKMFKSNTPIVKEVSVPVGCPSRGEVVLYTTVRGESALYRDFNSFYSALKKEVDSNVGKLSCPLKVRAGGEDYLVVNGDYMIAFLDDYSMVTTYGSNAQSVLDDSFMISFMVYGSDAQSVLNLHANSAQLYVNNHFIKASVDNISVLKISN